VSEPPKNALLIAAAFICAVRLAREEIKNSPKSLLKIPLAQRADHSMKRTLRLNAGVLVVLGFRSIHPGRHELAAEGWVGSFMRSAPAVSGFGSG
jgi:hypothetical protein